RRMAPSVDPDLFAAAWLRSGQLRELRRSPTGRRTVGGGKEDYLGDLPGAIKEFYVPLLETTVGLPDSALIRNRYVPLAVHFERVSGKLQRWLNDVDDSRQQSLEALFVAIAP